MLTSVEVGNLARKHVKIILTLARDHILLCEKIRLRGDTRGRLIKHTRQWMMRPGLLESARVRGLPYIARCFNSDYVNSVAIRREIQAVHELLQLDPAKEQKS
jgi:hypothetical protein